MKNNCQYFDEILFEGRMKKHTVPVAVSFEITLGQGMLFSHKIGRNSFEINRRFEGTEENAIITTEILRLN